MAMNYNYIYSSNTILTPTKNGPQATAITIMSAQFHYFTLCTIHCTLRVHGFPPYRKMHKLLILYKLAQRSVQDISDQWTASNKGAPRPHTLNTLY